MSKATAACDQLAEKYNRESHDVTLDREALRVELLSQAQGDLLYRTIIEDRPCLFADSPVFVSACHIKSQARIIAAVERVVALPAYRRRVLAYAPISAQFEPKACGVFLSYDFHLSQAGPKLIEINTNAGGAMLNELLAHAQTRRADSDLSALFMDNHKQMFMDMFMEEWRLERGNQTLNSIAIVDENPESQFLFPEFLLFQNLFLRNGIDAVICDPSELAWRHGGLWHGERRIDLVYSRLTDFGMIKASNRNLLEAYLAKAVVLTPHPYAHALYADKRNLILLTDEMALLEMGVDAETRSLLLSGIAHTIKVRPEEADTLWSARKHLFFKPAAGYGSKAAYRGDKLTRRVFNEILQGDYVAQTLVLPSGRRLMIDAEPQEFKLDQRNYVYQGRVQMIAGRLYQGQTTNLRTPGGGFAPVIALPSANA